MITPQTNIQLLQCPLTADQENQLLFDNVQAQNAYFEGLPKTSLTNCTYQRKDHTIRYEGNVDSLYKYNYVRYKNAQFGNRWFYAFITGMDYINEEVTAIHIKTDVLQTWHFDYILEPSFVEREHVIDDTIGAHTVPENLEYGPYILNRYLNNPWLDLTNTVICMQVSDLPKTTNGSTPATYGTLPLKVYNSMPSGCYYLIFQTGSYAGLNAWINAFNADGKQDAILSIFPLPYSLVANGTTGGGSTYEELTNNIYSPTYIAPTTYGATVLGTVLIDQKTDLSGYVPKNNKLFTAPYCYFYLNTFTGSSIEFHYEDFNGNPQFQIEGAVTSGGEIKVYPKNMLNSTDDSGYGYGVSYPGLPQGSWNNDTYLNWKALNMDGLQIQTTASVASNTLGFGTDLLGLNLFGAGQRAISIAETIAQAQNQINVAKKLPDQARGDTATQSLTYSKGLSDGGFYEMCIKPEYAKMIDDYFTMYGYKVNILKTPDLWSRQYYNYIKTIGLNIIADIPQNDIIEIKQIFDRGITFWHNPNYFLNYSIDNAII